MADVFVAAALFVALTKAKHLINAVNCALLGCDHAASFRTDVLLVRRVQQLAVPSVTGAALAVLAAVGARAKSGSFGFLDVLDNVVIKGNVFIHILNTLIKLTRLTFHTVSL